MASGTSSDTASMKTARTHQEEAAAFLSAADTMMKSIGSRYAGNSRASSSAVSQKSAVLKAAKETAVTTPGHDRDGGDGSTVASNALPRADADERKLVTVRQIQHIQNLGRHLRILVDGWTVMVPATYPPVYKEGDMVIYCEVDAWFPGGANHKFPEVGNPTTLDGELGYLVGTEEVTVEEGGRTVKAISQGHLFPLWRLPAVEDDYRERRKKYCNYSLRGTDFHSEEYINCDYSQMLGVKKFESTPQGPSGPTTTHLPSFIAKTDIKRVQACPNLFADPKYRSFVFQETIKLDGSSMTAYFVRRSSKYFRDVPAFTQTHPACSSHPEGRFGVCTKKRDVTGWVEGDIQDVVARAIWSVVARYKLDELLLKIGKSIALQGELVGPKLGSGISNNYFAYDDASPPELFVFRIWDIDAQKAWDPHLVEDFAKKNHLRHVPVRGYVVVPSIAKSRQDLISRADATGTEGLVFKNCSTGQSFKVLSVKYLLGPPAPEQPLTLVGLPTQPSREPDNPSLEEHVLMPKLESLVTHRKESKESKATQAIQASTDVEATSNINPRRAHRLPTRAYVAKPSSAPHPVSASMPVPSADLGCPNMKPLFDISETLDVPVPVKQPHQSKTRTFQMDEKEFQLTINNYLAKVSAFKGQADAEGLHDDYFDAEDQETVRVWTNSDGKLVRATADEAMKYLEDKIMRAATDRANKYLEDMAMLASQRKDPDGHQPHPNGLW